MTLSRCKDCGAAIVWLKMPGTGRPNPANADSVKAAPGDEFRWGVHVSHFDTCPKRHPWRRYGQ